MKKKSKASSIMINKQVYLSSMNLFSAYLSDLGLLTASLEQSGSEVFELHLEDLHTQLEVLEQIYYSLNASVAAPVLANNSSVESLN